MTKNLAPALALLFGLAFGSTAAAENCPDISDAAYETSRYTLCKAFIKEELDRYYVSNRLDGADSGLLYQDATRLTDRLSARARGEEAELAEAFDEVPNLSPVIRGLLATEVFSEDSVEKYCRYKLDFLMAEESPAPRVDDPEVVRDIDKMLGCTR